MKQEPRSLRLRVVLAALMIGAGVPAVQGNDAHPPPSAEPDAAGKASPFSAEARGLLRLGEILAAREDYASAELAYRRVLESSASRRIEQQEALVGLAKTYRQQGALTKAVAVCEKFLKEFPDDSRVPDMLLDLGRVLRAMGAHKSAINRFYSVLNATLKLQSTDFEHYQLLARTAQFEIAETHFQNGNYAEAGKFFGRLRLLDLAPVDRARAHFKCAYATQLVGELEPAVRLLREFIEKWPNDENIPEARYILATTLRRLNKHEEALATTLELLRTEYAHSEADPQRRAFWQRRTGNQLANEFFQSGDIPSALSIYQGLAALSDDPSWRLPTLYQVGVCSERLRAFERARSAYQAVVDGAKVVPENAELNELAKMAGWRIENMNWNEQTDQRLTTLTPPVAPSEPAKDDASPSTTTPPANLR